MTIYIVSGPPGCGKTANAEQLRAYFGASRVVDDASHVLRPRDNDLILTRLSLQACTGYWDLPLHLPVRFYTFDHAIQLLAQESPRA